jgi:hypothetical protein
MARAGFYWPAFNIADSAISVGAVLMAWDQFASKPAAPDSARPPGNLEGSACGHRRAFRTVPRIARSHEPHPTQRLAPRSARSPSADSYLTLHYRLADLDGSEYVSTFDLSPATLQMGSGQLAETLENCLLGLAAGERHVFELAGLDAFGPTTRASSNASPAARCRRRSNSGSTR